MTERGAVAVSRAPDRLRIGPSSLAWENGDLVIAIDEVSAPLPRRVRGSIRLTPRALPGTEFALDAARRHCWQPVAPKAAITVTLDRPELSWTGTAYMDSNHGAEPLADGFRHWTWSRAHLPGKTIILYDVHRRDGGGATAALGIADDGAITALPRLPVATLPLSLWRLPRATRADSAAVRCATVEDTPFYARSLVGSSLYGETARAMHETLSLDRFRSPIVRAMLPFRMPRRFF
jgi:carotenoid 1,2-hydratase